jgi:polyhydroxyalkanoate synthesis regulator phasin
VAENDGLRRYLKAGMTLTAVTRARADELVRGLIKTGEIERHKAQDWVEDLVKTGGDRSVALISTVRGEVRKPFKVLGFTNVDDVAKKSGDTLSPSPTAARKVTGRAAKKAPATRTPAKKTAARKAPATKTTGA